MTWYLKVQWHHHFAHEPVTLYSEVSDDGYETRKVQRFRDGHFEWADEVTETDRTGLSELPVGTVEDIAAQEEFAPMIISRREFEDVWQQARDSQ